MVIVAKDIPDGKPKSGRTWKVKQKSRASSQLRTGIQKILTKTYEERQVIKEQKQKVLELERNMKDETKLKRKGEILRQQERKKRLMEAEFKNTSYQAINPEKLKSMSKKQLRMVRKTSVNKNGQVELVNPWQSKTISQPVSGKRKR